VYAQTKDLSIEEALDKCLEDLFNTSDKQYDRMIREAVESIEKSQ
jgi:hypothetical protein